MAHIKRKYIDSHWSVFVVRGIVSLLFGWVALFSMKQDFPSLVSIVGVFLLCFSIIEFTNALHRARQKTGWGVSVTIAILDAIVALALLLTIHEATNWHLYMIAGYTFLRGICEIVTGFCIDEDTTDRFIWILCGICGSVMGIVVFNSSEFFVRFFGAYLFALGICSLIYGVHNRSQKMEDKAARKETAALAAKTRKRNAKKAKASHNVASRKK